MDVRIANHAESGSSVLTLIGQLDMQSAPTLEAALTRLLEPPRPRVVVDVSRLTFCDSIGLSALLVAHHACADRNGYLRLAGPSPFLLQLLTVVGVRDKVPIYSNVESACS